MIKIPIYSFLLILGMLITQFIDLNILQPHLNALTMVCLSYIMIEVGLEMHFDNKKLSAYGYDYLVAATAAAFPWIFCASYLLFVLDISIPDALLIGRFAAPTSAGVLFAMLAAAGLGTTWLFKKARILAIFDDLDTILMMVPLQIYLIGFKSDAVILIIIILILFYLAFKFHHKLKVPTNSLWLLYYSFLVVGACQIIEETVDVHFEVLLPAFALGCIMYNPERGKETEQPSYDHSYIEPKNTQWLWVDLAVKNLFMLLVGASLPQIQLGEMTVPIVIGHVALLTILSNIGKMFPSLFYRTEASTKERIALGIALFPRGEVGAGVLLIAMSFDLSNEAITLGTLSLALNLALTGIFILAVINLINGDKKGVSTKK